MSSIEDDARITPNDIDVPAEWNAVKLEQISTFTKKPRGMRITDLIAFIPMELIPDNGDRYADFKEIQKDEMRSGVYCEAGDILLPKITPCFENHKQGIVPGELTKTCFATTEVFPIKPNGCAHIVL